MKPFMHSYTTAQGPLQSLQFTFPVKFFSNSEQKSCKLYWTNEGLKSEPNYLKNIKFIIGELFSTLCFSIPTSKSQRTPLVRLKFPGGGRLRSSLRAHNGITADDAHLFLDVSICLRGFFPLARHSGTCYSLPPRIGGHFQRLLQKMK